ncbi:uncharacterized protein LOC106663965 [Cimex lectularius]|uniref:RNase H type-1 domain-containing protein n=1 Tax=Cimex lectularius TaxID=79782 RepID=A0A8I6RG77_CIMLE|nr:uncharacterized protein LOC106663965 [Cimex lectularius]
MPYLQVTLKWVPGHEGIYGNEESHKLANFRNTRHTLWTRKTNLPQNMLKGQQMDEEKNIHWMNSRCKMIKQVGKQQSTSHSAARIKEDSRPFYCLFPILFNYHLKNLKTGMKQQRHRCPM